MEQNFGWGKIDEFDECSAITFLPPITLLYGPLLKVSQHSCCSYNKSDNNRREIHSWL